MGFNVITYALILKYLNDSKTGLLRVQVSPDRKGIEFYKTDGSMLVISGDDWNAMTAEEQEKLSIITIFGNGKLVLHDDGIYKMITIENNSDYINAINKPKINSIELVGNKSLEDLGFSKVSKDGLYSSLIDLPHIPSKTSDLTNDTGLITEAVNTLRNYYRKTETYSNVEIDNKIDSMNLTSVEIVQELPTSDISENAIYLKVETGDTFYTQWIYIEGSWVNVGSMEINMDNYYKIFEIGQMLNNKVDSKVGYQLTQADFTTEEKEKLSQFENYVLKYATTNILGVAVPDGKTILLNNGVISAPSGAGKFPPGNVSNIVVVPNHKTLEIKWKDPNDLEVDGVNLSRWKGTKLVYKADSFPKNYLDGILAVDNTIRDEYNENGFIISGLENGRTYYFQLFPYSDTMAYNQNVTNRFEGMPEASKYKTMTAIIDTANSNPETCVTYVGSASDMTPGSSEWDEFFGIYPCLLKDGVEIGRLNPNDFAQFEDGTSADITSGNSGDVMIAFPRRGLKIENIGTDVAISVTNTLDDESFKYYAHQRGEVRKDVFYLGAYMSTLLGTKMYCRSGGQPYKIGSIGENRKYIRNKGAGYDMFGFYQLIFIQSMYILKYKNLDSQAVMGMGNTNNTAGILWHGSTNNKGMDYPGTNPPSGKTSMKLFGLCDLWGNIWQYIDGVFCNSSGELLTATTGFNSAGTGYINHGKIRTGFLGFINDVIGTSETGFISKDNAGSATTYYCDSTNIINGRMARMGGSVSSNTAAGMFYILFDMLDSSKDSYSGTRIMYL